MSLYNYSKGLFLSGTPIIGGTSGKVLYNSSGFIAESNLWIESANQIAQRNSTTAQSKLIYRTYTDGSNYERLFVGADHSGTGITGYGIFAEKAGTGSDRSLYIGTTGTGSLSFVTNNNSRWTIASTGALTANTDNSYSIGASNANRPQHVYVGSNVYATAFAITRGATTYASLQDNGDGIIRMLNGAGTGFSMLLFGGTTSSFPGLKRSTVGLQVRLADDSAFTSIQGKLATDTNYTAGAPAATGYLTIYDAAGTPYKVLCGT